MTNANNKIKVRSYLARSRSGKRTHRNWQSYCPWCKAYNIAPSFDAAVKRNWIHIVHHQLVGK
jgi:hypothetical protein